MRHPTPPSLPDRDGETLSVCEAHLTQEEALLTEMLRTLREVRAAFVRRDLSVLSTLRERQQHLQKSSEEIAEARKELRASLAPLLGIPAAEVTLRAAAQSLGSTAHASLLKYHARLSAMVREVEQLSRHNAILLGYARGFLECLFAGMTGVAVGERYDPQGQRRTTNYGSFLEARA
jgi:hypothetical protein